MSNALNLNPAFYLSPENIIWPFYTLEDPVEKANELAQLKITLQKTSVHHRFNAVQYKKLSKVETCLE